MYINENIIPDRPPPKMGKINLYWFRKKIFSNYLSYILSIITLFVLYLPIPLLMGWLFFDANWVGDSSEDCTGAGACWVFVREHFFQFMYGFYPEGLYWRPNLAGIILILLLSPLLLNGFKRKFHLIIGILFLYPFVAYTLIHGGYLGLEIVETDKWGGLMLTLILSIVGITVALPLGIMFALGRQSVMPVIKSFSIVYIEFWRGVPLVTVLFMASVMLPLLLPSGSDLDLLIRAMVGIILFQAAYIAEVVRGGLQSVSKGQSEAALALGLSYWKRMIFIILPQALKMVIPGIVNTFIALFKDTTLVLIIGMYDLLAIVNQANSNANWLRFDIEGYVFAGFIFWIFCFSMSRYSLVLEKKLGAGS